MFPGTSTSSSRGKKSSSTDHHRDLAEGDDNDPPFFHQQNPLVREEDIDQYKVGEANQEKAGLPPPPAVSSPLPRMQPSPSTPSPSSLRAKMTSDRDDNGLDAANAARATSSRELSDPSDPSDPSLSFLPGEIRFATPFLVFLLLLQAALSSVWVGAFIYPPLPDNYYSYADTDKLIASSPTTNFGDAATDTFKNYTSICTKLSDQFSASPRPLYQQPSVYKLLCDTANPFVMLILSVVTLSNPRGKTLCFECLSVALAAVHFLGTACMPSQTIGGRVGYVSSLIVSIYIGRECFRRRSVFASFPASQLARIVLTKVPTTALASSLPLFFMASDGISCLLDNALEPRLCEDKMSSLQTVSGFIVVVTLWKLNGFELGKNVLDMSSFLLFDFEPFRAQVFVAVSVFECALGVYIYALGAVIPCYDDFTATQRQSRSAARFLFQVLWVVLSVLLVEGKFLERTTAWEKRVRMFLLTDKHTETAPFLFAGLVAGMLVVSGLAVNLFRYTLKLREADECPYNRLDVRAMNAAFSATKFTSLLIFLFGAITVVSAPKRRHRLRFICSAVVAFGHSSLVLIAVLLNPLRCENESDGSSHQVDNHTLANWRDAVCFAAFCVAVPFLFLLSLTKAKTFLRLQLDADIEIHLQRSAVFCLSKISPMIYLLGEAYGCLTTSYSVDTCAVLVQCNFAVVLYLALSSILYLGLNHSQNHYAAARFLDFRGVDVFTVLSHIWEGVACVVAYSCFGLRPKNRASFADVLANDATALSAFTGVENEQWTVISSIVAFSTWLLLLGYMVVFVFGFFYMHKREVTVVLQLSGIDNDDAPSSRSTQCCSALETRAEKLFAFLRVPDEEITISWIYKAAFVNVTWTALVLSVGSFCLTSLRFIDPRLWLLGHALTKISYLFLIACNFSAALFLFSDLKRDPNVWVWMIVVLVPVLSFSLRGFIYLLSGDAGGAAGCVALSALTGLLLNALKEKRDLMIAMTTPVWRKQKLLSIFSAAYVFLPTVIFLTMENVSCIARASFDTSLLRARAVDSEATYGSNVVEEKCSYLSVSTSPLLVACGYVMVIRLATARKSKFTMAHLLTLRLSLFDSVEIAILCTLLVAAIGAFCFRNSKVFDFAVVKGLFVVWCLVFITSISFSYALDRRKAKELAAEPRDQDEEERDETQKRRTPFFRGVSSRTQARRSIILLGIRTETKKGRETRSSVIEKHRVSDEADEGGMDNISPGLM